MQPEEIEDLEMPDRIIPGSFPLVMETPEATIGGIEIVIKKKKKKMEVYEPAKPRSNGSDLF